MANNNHCNSCNNNRNGDRRCRCRRGCMKMARGCWQNFPYYGGPCPDLDGCYGWRSDDSDSDDCCCRRRCDDDCDSHRHCDDDRDERRRCRRRRRWDVDSAVFTASLPVAVSANGIIPLVLNNPCRDSNFDVNSGLITVEKAGTYLATYTVRVPETAAVDTMMTLNVNDASQSPATTRVLTEAGTTTSEYIGQAIFQADEDDTVTLRTSEAINITETAVPPLFALSLVKLDD